MTTHLKGLLERYAPGPHFDGKGDHERDASWYYHAMLECLVPLIARAAVDDGVSAETVMKIGYARVSTDDQNMSLQLDALQAAGCDRIFTDQLSRATTKRPGLDDP